ncbi:MAG: DNA internalization-related competence protein ComEC/Rec2 [Burkholderiaceae bacterium]
MARFSPAWAVPVAAVLLQTSSQLPGRSWLFGSLALGLVLLPASAWSAWLRFGCCALLAFALLGLRIDVALGDRLAPALEGVDLRVQGAVVAGVVAHEHGVSFRFRVESCRRADDALPCGLSGDIQLGWYGRHPLPRSLWPGDRLQLNVRLKRPVAVVNPAGFDAELWALQQGVLARGYVRRDSVQTVPEARNGLLSGASLSARIVLAQMRVRVAAVIGNALAAADRDAAGVVDALVTGRQSAIRPALWDMFNRTGVSHLMSISGLHVTMFAAMMLWLVRALLRIPVAWLSPLLERVPAQTIAWTLAVPAAFAYAAFSGWGIPAQRTCWMLLIAGLAIRLGRAGDIAGVMALAAAWVCLLDPWSVLSSGFWLSFTTVAAIVACGSPTRPWQDARWAEPVRAQWAASVVLVPLAAYWFGAIPLLGPIANAFAIPLVSALITPLAMAGAALGLFSDALAALALSASAWLGQAMIAALHWLDHLPLTTWVTGSQSRVGLILALIGAVVVLTPWRPVPRLAGVALMMPLLVGIDSPPAAGGWRADVIDVGQGTAVMISTARHRLVYDTGPTNGSQGDGAGDRIIAPWLRHRGIARIDLLVLSHEDRDHSGGAEELVRQFTIGRLDSSLPAEHPLRALAVAQRPCLRGSRWQWDGVSFEYLHPGVPELAPGGRINSNARSCVLRIRGAGGSMLLSGDIEAAQEARLVEILGSAGLRSDILLVPHHGSRTSSSENFLAAVAPSTAIVQAGYRNRYRHPSAAVMARYRERGIEVLRTDWDGAISITFSPGVPPRIERARAPGGAYWRLVTRIADVEDEGLAADRAPAPAEAARAPGAP